MYLALEFVLIFVSLCQVYSTYAYFIIKLHCPPGATSKCINKPDSLQICNVVLSFTILFTAEQTWALENDIKV